MACRAPAPPTDVFVVVCLSDDALFSVPGPIMREYEIGRDIAVLEEPNDVYKWGGLKTLDEQPTRYYCRPLSARHRTRASSITIGNDGSFSVNDTDFWTIFAYHIDRITDYLDHNGAPIEMRFAGTEGRDYHLHHEMHEKIAAEHYVEVAGVIIKKGMRSNTAPFGTGDSWLVSRRAQALSRRPALPKLDVHPESANASPIESPTISGSATPPGN